MLSTLGEDLIQLPLNRDGLHFPPKEVGKEYLWSRVKLTFKDNDVKHSIPSYVKEPNGIVSVVEEYYVSFSPTDLEGGAWGRRSPHTI